MCVRVFMLWFFHFLSFMPFSVFITVGPASRVLGLRSGYRTCRFRVSRAEAELIVCVWVLVLLV